LAVKQKRYIDTLTKIFRNRYKDARDSKDSFYKTLVKTKADTLRLLRLETDYTNKKLASFVLNDELGDKTIQTSKKIIRKYKPIYMSPTTKYGRAHFCAPFKIAGNLKIDTFWFNLIVIWLVSFLMYLALYFNILRKMISGFGDSGKRKKDSSFLIIKEISSW
jgi:hypothetical protein